MAEQGIDLSRYLRHGAKITENGSDDWQTPRAIFDALDKRFHFTRDAAASRENRHCKLYWDIRDDALLMDWSAEKSLFINPPYSREGANKRGNSSRLTQSFHFFMFEPIFSPVNAL
ncbi:DNA N-6-adenine-methyltransferase, partial [Klebsiella pneumoniae]|uniref:DNA N-6-adenine-methyltransferase n=1 Tax=Klebsiella pneumoniae TaxID=573 RepID=UPI001C8DDBFD